MRIRRNELGHHNHNEYKGTWLSSGVMGTRRNELGHVTMIQKAHSHIVASIAMGNDQIEITARQHVNMNVK